MIESDGRLLATLVGLNVGSDRQVTRLAINAERVLSLLAFIAASKESGSVNSHRSTINISLSVTDTESLYFFLSYKKVGETGA